MAALDKDTRLVMTIMYVGAMAGMNVYFYSVYGIELPFTAFTHAILFSLITVGVIMMQKALFDLIVNERLEMWLLNRKIDFYWEKRKRDERQKEKIRESMKSNRSNYYAQGYDEVSEEFLRIEP
jgi:polyferredoxin